MGSTSIMTKAEFARVVGVTKGAITVAVTRGSKALAAAAVGDRIDASHPAAIQYIEKHLYRHTGAEPPPHHDTGGLAKNNAMKAGPADTIDPMALKQIPEDIRALIDMPLRALVAIFGTDRRFVDWLKAIKDIEEIQGRRLKSAKEEGVLVARRLVEVGVIDPIDTAHRQLMTDGAKTISVRLRAMADAGRTQQECEDFVREQIGSFVKPLKKKMAKAIGDAAAS